MRKILLPMLMAGVVSFAGCDDFLSEYSQDQIVAKKVQDLDELLLGDGYLQSSAIASGPSITIRQDSSTSSTTTATRGATSTR